MKQGDLRQWYILGNYQVVLRSRDCLRWESGSWEIAYSQLIRDWSNLQGKGSLIISDIFLNTFEINFMKVASFSVYFCVVLLIGSSMALSLWWETAECWKLFAELIASNLAYIGHASWLHGFVITKLQMFTWEVAERWTGRSLKPLKYHSNQDSTVREREESRGSWWISKIPRIWSCASEYL